MSSPNWIGVRVAMSSAFAGAKIISSITKASPAVATSTSHGYANGDYLLMSATGMDQVNNRVFRGASVAADTVQLEDEDTTAYEAFTGGTAKKITFGTAFATLMDISATGGDFSMIDTTTIHDHGKTEEPGMPSAMGFSFESAWDLADTALQAAIAASTNRTPQAFLLTFQNGYKMAFYGHIGASGIPKGSTGQKVKTTINITASGAPTYYAT